jgi:hypothetical protein
MSYIQECCTEIWSEPTRALLAGSPLTPANYTESVCDEVWNETTRELTVVSVLSFDSAAVVFDGKELRVKFTANGTLPAEGTIYPFDSVGVPDLRDASNVRIPLVYKICDCKINRTTGDITVWACYEIPNDLLESGDATYIAKGATGYTLTMTAAMCSEEGGLETAGVSAQAVTNSSEVGTDGLVSINSMGYNEGSGHVTIYCNPTKADDSGDGLSWANAKKTLSAAITLLNAQTNNLPHRLLIANGTTWDGTTATMSMTRSGASGTSKLWIGGGDSGDASTVRPIIMFESCTWSGSGDFIHLNGLDIQFGTGANVGNALCQIGGNSSTNVSISDCKANFPQGVAALHTHRNIYTGNSGVNPTGAYQGSGQVTNFYDNHFVNFETDKAAATVGGHLTYDIGETESGDAVQTGSQVYHRNTVVGRAGIRDMGRQRAESLFWSVACHIGFDTGAVTTCGVDQVNSPTCTYDHATRTLTRNSGTTSNCYVWANATYLYAASGTGVSAGYFQVSSITSTTFVLSGAGLGAGADGSANVVIRIGDVPARSRNWNGRHVFNLDPGNYFTNDWFVYPNPVPNFRDTAGYWYRDSGGTAPSRNTSNPRGGIGSGGQRSSDGGDILIDTHLERVSGLRLSGMGIDFQPKTYAGENQAQTWRFRKSIIDGFNIAGSRHLARTSSLQTAGGVVNYNVYANPSTASAFCYTDTHPDNNQTFANWKTSTGWDANSVQIDTLAIEAGTTTSDSPDAEDYDLTRPSCAWGETGTIGTRERLANAFASRPAGQWDYNLTAQAMTRWLLEQIRPTDRSTWVTEPAGEYGYIGAADYTLGEIGTVIQTEELGPSSATTAEFSWTAASDTKVIGYVIRWGTTSGVYTSETISYGRTTGATWNPTGLTPSTTYYFKVYGFDGWNLSDGSSEQYFTTGGGSTATDGERIYGTTGINVDFSGNQAWTNPGNVNGNAADDSTYAQNALTAASSDFIATAIPATAIDGALVGIRLGFRASASVGPAAGSAVTVTIYNSTGTAIAGGDATLTGASATDYEDSNVVLLGGTYAELKAIIEAGLPTTGSVADSPRGLVMEAGVPAGSTTFRIHEVWIVPLIAEAGGGGGTTKLSRKFLLMM